MSTGEPVPAPSLLADLESRQDELLRLLAELETRTEQALAALGVNIAGSPAVAVSTPPAAEPNRPAAGAPAAAPATSRRKAA
jgi:hypothetical protein